eukprot:TRINITY_DN348_c0_g2_i3.p1 TRINITY_DN348_c0_g2~~TRINITY_DN348_c0_g2_i3.p1  ORF type:complete len:260 (+),score=76.65 TRINITY_DN348_c0_g2_i3:50-781(+)
MIRRPPRSTHCISSAASDVYKRQYQRRVHGNIMSNSKSNQSSHSPKNSLFACKHPGCNKVFAAKFSWNRHKCVHCNFKPFSCEYCGKKFSLAQNLKEHSYSHTKERPYICGIASCTRSFRHPSELSLHRRVHPQYKLRKYHYLAVKSGGEVKNAPRKFLVIKTTTSRIEAFSKKEEVVGKEGSECSSQLSSKTKHSDEIKGNVDIDMKFLEYLKNITEIQEGRPMLPFPESECESDKNFWNNA